MCLLIPGRQESLLLNPHTPGGAEGHMSSFRMQTVLQRESFWKKGGYRDNIFTSLRVCLKVPPFSHYSVDEIRILVWRTEALLTLTLLSITLYILSSFLTTHFTPAAHSRPHLVTALQVPTWPYPLSLILQRQHQVRALFISESFLFFIFLFLNNQRVPKLL